MASSKIGRRLRTSGFKKRLSVPRRTLFAWKWNKLVIADGLNEGYTEILNKRLFQKYITPARREIYYPLQFIAYGIEQIVGQKEMEKAYFDNDLEYVVSSLAQYIGRESSETFLTAKMDNLLELYKKSIRENSIQAKSANHELEKISREMRINLANVMLEIEKQILLKVEFQKKNLYIVYTI